MIIITLKGHAIQIFNNNNYNWKNLWYKIIVDINNDWQDIIIMIRIISNSTFLKKTSN